MTRREKLQEQYEDALFALLMDDLAVEEGKKAYEENKRLKADSSFEVPSESRKRCVETIARCCRKKQFQGISNRCYHAFSKVAVIAMLTIMHATAAFAASPTLRTSAMNLLVETFEDHTGFRLVYTPPTENASDDGLNFTVNWIPEGYELESHRENRFSARCVYSSDNCQELSIGLFEGENTGLCLDTENAEVHDEMINGKKAVIITKEGVSQLCLIDEKKGNYLLITGSMEQTDDLVKIAQNIQFE